MNSINCKNESNTTNNRKDKAKQDRLVIVLILSTQLRAWRCRLRALWEFRKASCAQPWVARAALHADHTISAFNWSHRKRGSLLEDFCFLRKGRLLFCFHALNVLKAFRKLKLGQNEPRLHLYLLKIQIFWGGDGGHNNELNSHISWRTDRLMGLCAKKFMAQEGSWIPCGLFYPLDPQYMEYGIGMSDVRTALELLRGSDGLDYKQALLGLDWLIPSITFSFSPPPPSSLQIKRNPESRSYAVIADILSKKICEINSAPWRAAWQPLGLYKSLWKYECYDLWKIIH